MTGIPFPDISPEAVSFTVFGLHLVIWWYALAYIVGFVIGWRVSVAALKRPRLWAGDRAAMAPAQPEPWSPGSWSVS